jgi:prophage tail gpP-like protein
VSERNRAVVSMHFQDGSSIDSWLRLSLKDDYTDPLADLSFVCGPPRERITEYREKLAKGQEVTVKINGVTQGVFLIQQSNRTISKADGVVFNVRCHTKLVTPYEGSVDPTITLKAEAATTVETVVLKAFELYGFTALDGDETKTLSAMTGKPIKGGKAARPLDALKATDLQAHDNESAYNFAARVFSRLGAALRIAVDGTLLLSTPDYDQEPSYALVQDFDGTLQGDRFFGEIDVQDSNEDQFSDAEVRGNRGSKKGETATATPKGAFTSLELNAARPPYKSDVAPHKPLFLKDKGAADAERCRTMAQLALGLRARKAFSVTGVVDGFVSTTGSIWTVNTVAHVTLAADGLDEPMWILSREFMQDRKGGQRTQITLLPLGALILGDMPS